MPIVVLRVVPMAPGGLVKGVLVTHVTFEEYIPPRTFQNLGGPLNSRMKANLDRSMGHPIAARSRTRHDAAWGAMIAPGTHLPRPIDDAHHGPRKRHLWAFGRRPPPPHHATTNKPTFRV